MQYICNVIGQTSVHISIFDSYNAYIKCISEV